VRVKLGGKWWRFVASGNLKDFGRMDDPGVARGRVIRVATWQSEEELLDTILHELIHCCRPELEENTVTEMAREMARVMWRLGYRRAEPPPLPGLPAAPPGRSGARRPR
jgi:hypothetical protein